VVHAQLVEFVFDRIGRAEYAILLEPRVARVPHNRQQPRARIAAVVAGEELECAQVSFLNDVLCVGVVVDQPAGKVVRSAQMRQSNFFKPNDFALVWQRTPSRPLVKTAARSFLFPGDGPLPQKSGFRLGGGQYRNAVASGRFSFTRYS